MKKIIILLAVMTLLGACTHWQTGSCRKDKEVCASCKNAPVTNKEDCSDCKMQK